MVPKVGLEPTRPFGHCPLKAARLPIPRPGLDLYCLSLLFPWCPGQDSNLQNPESESGTYTKDSVTGALGKTSWCPGWESNPHSFRNRILSPARLPFPPPGQVNFNNRLGYSTFLFLWPRLAAQPWCPGRDLNPHDLSITAPSRQGVYQFHHLGKTKTLKTTKAPFGAFG